MRRRPYRVLHVIDSLGLGGAQVVLLNLARQADRTRFEIEAVCLHGRGLFFPQLQAAQIPVWSLSFHHYFPSYVPGLLWLMLRRRYDVVHCHLLASNVVAKPLAALCGVGVRINHDHCNDKPADPRRWAVPADRWANRFATHVLAVSESTRRFVVEEEGFPAERTTTLYNGVDCATHAPRPEKRETARKRWGIPQDAYVIGGLGRLVHQKNFALFLDVAAEILRSHPEAFFVIAGYGDEENALRAQAVRLGISQRVSFLGLIAETAELYPALDLLLLTSRYEGLPITILEAMASGVPIVASRLDGIAEVLSDGADASLAASEDQAAFVQSVNRLMGDPSHAAALAENALRKVRDEYSAARMTREIEAIYARYLEPRSAASAPPGATLS